MSEEAFDRVIDVNLKGAFNCVRHVAPIMMKQRYGRIVSVSSVVGLFGNAGQVNYSASKAGIIGLVQKRRSEGTRCARGIMANAVAPGFIGTEMTKAMGEKGHRGSAVPHCDEGIRRTLRMWRMRFSFWRATRPATLQDRFLAIDGGDVAMSNGKRRTTDSTA